MNTNDLCNEIKKIRNVSEDAWEMAADTPREEAEAARFVASWDAWGEHWDAAEQAILDGDLRTAQTELEAARRREVDYGDSSPAEMALRLTRRMQSLPALGEIA